VAVHLPAFCWCLVAVNTSHKLETTKPARACAGIQLSALVLSVILITIAGALFSERGTIVTVFILCYALTSFLGGYVSGSFYAGQEGKARCLHNRTHQHGVPAILTKIPTPSQP